MTTPPRLRVRSLLAGLALSAAVGAVASVVPGDAGATADQPAPTRPVTAGPGR